MSVNRDWKLDTIMLSIQVILVLEKISGHNRIWEHQILACFPLLLPSSQLEYKLPQEDHIFKHGHNGQTLGVMIKGVFLLRQKWQAQDGKCQWSLCLVRQKNIKPGPSSSALTALVHHSIGRAGTITAAQQYNLVFILFRAILTPAIAWL